MLRNGVWRRVCLYCLPAICQQQPPVIDALKRRVLDDLAHIPNYTCTETIERSTRGARSRSFEDVDRYRVEVAYVGGKELFGWPGSDKLDEPDLTTMVPGTVSNGEFALLAGLTFSSPSVVFADVHEDLIDGKLMLRCQYRVPVSGSGWILGVPGQQAQIAYHGSMLADRERLDLLAIDSAADQIPRSFGFKTVWRNVEFARVKIGESEFLLPAHATLRASGLDGDELKNEIRFSGCHQYSVETEIQFEAVDAPTKRTKAGAPKVPAAASPPVESVRLPAEFDAELDLESAIDSDTAAVGDPFTAVLRRSVTKDGLTLILKGAILHGRISRLDLVGGRRHLDLRFLYFDAGGQHVDLGDRENSFSGYIGGDVSAREPGPLRSDGRRLRLTTDHSVILHSRLADTR
ncbi:MAG: hypothetical protein ACLQKA_06590 [Bryobacteraceae bacterium]